MNNPYESPAAEAQVAKPKTYNRSLHLVAKASWMIPLGGLAVSIFLNRLPAAELGFVGGILFILGTMIGFVLGATGLALSWKYQKLAWNALAGLLLSMFFILIIVVGFTALAALRDIQRQQDQGNAAPLGTKVSIAADSHG